MQETMDVLSSTLSNQSLKGKPLLIYANKQDVIGARTAKELQDILPIPQEYQDQLLIAETCASVPDPLPEGFTPDPNIEAGIEMLCKQILSSFDELQARVIRDSQLKAIEEAKKRIERERKVLRSKIASAFVNSLPKEFVEANQIEADEANVFDENEGLNFLAAEIGEDSNNLPQIARSIAAMTGYQRLALQIAGALKAPISKKKVPMSWEEIYELIAELRKELGLPVLS
jgi:HPt (histidine-containing phosphotransfer) domain-containing protein